MGSTRGERIPVLHVDDEPGFADMTADFLERVDDRFGVETATSASAGLDRLAETDYECVVSDYQMPDRNGIEFLEAVREEYPDLPFVLFTGKGSEEVASEAFSAGATDYVQKDTATDQYELLANRIQNAVEQRRTQRQATETERRLRTIAEHSNDVLWEFSADWTECLFINSAYEDIWGGAVADLREEPRSFLDEVHPDDRAAIADGMERLSAGESVDLEIRVNAAEEFGRWVWIQGEPVFDDDGDVDKVVGFARDVTDRTESERERERTNTILRTMVEHLPMGVLVGDTDREVLMANDRFGEILGMSMTGEEFIGRDCQKAAEEMQDLFADPEGFVDGIEERIADREPVRNEELALADGRVLERDYVPYSLPDGQANLWLYRDVTDRRQQTRELNTRAKAMDASIDGMALLNADEEYVYVNEAHVDVYGYDDPEAFVGETWRMCYDDEEQARFEEEVVPALYDEGNWRGEATGRRRDGSTFPQELSLTTTDDGGIICVVRDISDRKKREHGLERLHAATRNLMTATSTDEVATLASETATQVLEHPMNGIHLYDAEADALVPVAWSDETDAVLGESPPALPVDDSLAGRVYRTGQPEVFGDVDGSADALNPDTPFRSECVLPLGDHGVVLLSSREPDDFDRTDETLARVLAANIEAALDRVEQRRELQQERDRLDEFSSIVSHDLQNPLSIADGRVELAQRDCDSEHLDAARDALRRMDRIVDRTLTLARSGRVVGDTEPVDLSRVARRCWQNVDATDADLQVEAAPTIRADSGRLRHLFENLYRNAVEHGGDDVAVTVGALPERDGFYVADDGPGIPEDERDQVFEVGYSTDEDGTGLGLNITKEIAIAHGWDVAVTDSDAGGARFEVVGVDVAEE